MSANDSALPIVFKKIPKDALRSVFPLLIILVFACLFHFFSDGIFLTPRNLSNLSRQICVNLTLAVGMTLVILTSGIDLSVGSVLALSGMCAAISQVHWGLSGWGVPGAIFTVFISLGVGAGAGALTGSLVSRFKITPFIVSLGMMVICRGITLIISGAQAVAPIGAALSSLSSDYLPLSASAWLLTAGAVAAVFLLGRNIVTRKTSFDGILSHLCALLFIGVSYFAFCGYRGIPYMAFVGLFCAAAAALCLRYTRFGRFLYAIGCNREAAELSGIPVSRTLFLAYFVMGILSGLSGLMDVSRVNGAVPSAGELAELDAIAAVVIGGTSLMGGSGSIGGTLFGVLIMGTLNNGMSLIGISEHYQKVFKGIVIILAVYMDIRSKKR